MDDLAETRPRPAAERTRRIVLEPISASVCNLTYACLLVPRFSQHYLTGDLRDRLSGWMLHLSVAYGWRLDHIAIRPGYILWMVNVPPATAPGHLMRIYRQQTSEKILAEFSRIKADNPGGDFWAPNYLIMAGSQPPSDQLIAKFIEQTRHRQGLT
jgi:REP element-mobilizing transposase RayT